MRVIRQQCTTCGGFGHHYRWEIVSEGIGERKKFHCGDCNGIGHIKYVVFSIEEAKVIAKHCGLSTEELED